MKKVSRRYSESSSFKMAALFAALLGTATVILGYFLYDFGSKNFVRETEAAINREIQNIVILTSGESQEGAVKLIQETSSKSEHPFYYYQDIHGQYLAGNIDAIPEDVERLSEGLVRFYIEHHNDEHDVAAKIHTFVDGSRLLVGRDISDIMISYERFLVFAAIIIFFMLIVVGVSFFISLIVVKRINTIAGTAEHIIETGDLSQRISVYTEWDDLGNLARVLNDMLSRIELLMQGVKSVGDNIAHDLRTPLTRLKNHLELLKGGSPTQKDIKELIQEVDGVLVTFNALLRITNIEKGKLHQVFEEVDLALLLHDIVELYEPLAEKHKQAINIEVDVDAALISGDRDLLFQAFANLLDNAIKFAPEESNIRIAAELRSDVLLVSISDNGPGIDPEIQEKVFDRFYRADSSRNKSGNGLGLSLVKAVLDVHGASVALIDNNPGVRAEITFNVTNK